MHLACQSHLDEEHHEVLTITLHNKK